LLFDFVFFHNYNYNLNYLKVLIRPKESFYFGLI
jgi:hypothetical protein